MRSNEILACCVIALGVCGVVAGSLLTEPTAPAAAPAPTATVQPTPDPTPEPTPEVPLVNPLTGETTTKDYSKARPVAIMVENNARVEKFL